MHRNSGRSSAMLLLSLVFFMAPGPAGVLLAQAEAREAQEALDLRREAEAWRGRQAFGVYMFGRKAGFGAIDISVAEFQGKPALLVAFEAEMRIKMFGETSTMSSKEEAWYSLEGRGPVLRIESVETEDGTTTRKTLQPADDGWEVVTEVGDRVEKRPVAAPKADFAHESEIDRWLASEPEKGTKHEVWMVDLDKDDINDRDTMTYLGSERRMVSGLDQKVHAVRMKMDGVNAKVTCLNYKMFLEASVGTMMRLVAEEERIARRMDTKIDDVTFHLSVVIERDLGEEPGAIGQLTAEVSGLGEFELPQSHRQRLEPREGLPALLHLRRDFRVETAAPLPEAERERWTAAEPEIESGHETIRKQARAIVGEEEDALKQAGLLQHWIYENLEGTAAKNSDSALTILEQMAGDCSEHARLFVALARSLGIPAREVTGLLYTKFEKPLFGWHAWAEVHDGHQWVSVDPAWDQVHVDATHIRFGTGTEDLAWVTTIGSLKLRVLEFEKE